MVVVMEGGGGSVLVREPRFGFDKSVLREAETVELCHGGCHYISTCHSRSVGKHANIPYEIPSSSTHATLV